MQRVLHASFGAAADAADGPSSRAWGVGMPTKRRSAAHANRFAVGARMPAKADLFAAMPAPSKSICHVGDVRVEPLQLARCLIPGFDGAILSTGWKDALWARFFMGAPRRQRRSVERYNIVKRA